MLRERLTDRLRSAMKGREKRAVSTIRLILTAVKDRDIAARGKGNADGISDQDILQVLQTMVRQRRESIVLYEQGARLELAEQEAEEIAIIESFLPEPLDEAAMEEAIGSVVGEIGASSIKDMGRTMAILRERYAGRMDFAKAGGGEGAAQRRLSGASAGWLGRPHVVEKRGRRRHERDEWRFRRNFSTTFAPASGSPM